MSADRAKAILAEACALAAQQHRRTYFWRSSAIAATIAIAGGIVWLSPITSPTPTAQTVAAATISLPHVQSGGMTFFETPNYQLDRISLDGLELLS